MTIRRRAPFGLVIAAGALATTLFAPASAMAVTETVWSMRSGLSTPPRNNLFLTLPTSTKYVQILGPMADPRQNWVFVHAGLGKYRILNWEQYRQDPRRLAASRGCLAINIPYSSPSSSLVQVGYCYPDFQSRVAEWGLWRFSAPPFPSRPFSSQTTGFQIVNVKTGQCLDVQNAQARPGTTVHAYPCKSRLHHAENQIFYLNQGTATYP